MRPPIIVLLSLGLKKLVQAEGAPGATILDVNLRGEAVYLIVDVLHDLVRAYDECLRAALAEIPA